MKSVKSIGTMKVVLFQAAVLGWLLITLVVAIATPKLVTAERPHWPSRTATIGEQLVHDNEQCRADPAQC